jgi:hypothetical protein
MPWTVKNVTLLVEGDVKIYERVIRVGVPLSRALLKARITTLLIRS